MVTDSSSGQKGAAMFDGAELLTIEAIGVSSKHIYLFPLEILLTQSL